MSSTRSACKCVLTGLSLDPDHIVMVSNVGAFHKQFLNLWMSEYNCMPHDGSPVPDAVRELITATNNTAVPAEQLQKCQIAFARHQLDLLINASAQDATETYARHDYVLAKILVGLLLTVDPREGLEACVRQVFALESMTDNVPAGSNLASDGLHVLFTSLLASIIANSSLARIMTELDDYRINVGPRQSDQAMLRLALAGLADQMFAGAFALLP